MGPGSLKDLPKVSRARWDSNLACPALAIRPDPGAQMQVDPPKAADRNGSQQMELPVIFVHAPVRFR